MEKSPESIELYCRAAKEYKASDLILHAGEPPILRISGSMTAMEAPSLDPSDLKRLRALCLVPEAALDFDASYITAEGDRFRVNFHSQLGSEAAVLRRINPEPPDIDRLGVPSRILTDWARRKSGIVIVSGPTGSGKSTTLAAVLEWVNRNLERHIVTIEDPVEFIFKRDKALFTQRAVGLDTPSFAEGLRRSLRQAPDMIFVGEIRDHETAVTAIQAAETGHLVFATLHASDVAETVERLMALLPTGDRASLLQVLSGQLLGVLCQKLLPSVDGGMVLACEFLTNAGRTRRCILNADIPTLRDHLSTAEESESLDFLRSLHRLIESGKLDEETALLAAPNPAELRRRIRGIINNSEEGQG